MAWNKGSGPWGAPSGGGSSGGSNRPNPPGEQPDFEAILRRGRDSFRSMFSGGGNGSLPPDKGWQGVRLFVLGALALLVLWLASGIYRVDADEQGVVLRFGMYHRTTEPGLNYHLPYPVEEVFTPRVTTINREQVGFHSANESYTNTQNSQIVPEESLMLTGDKNIVSAQFEVQWRIKDAGKFLFNVRDPEQLVKPVAETAMREIMGNTPLSLAISDKRQSIAEATQQLMQRVFDEYQCGIEIFEVNLLAVDAPQPVVDAFIDVLAAQQEKETLQNQARKYRDGIIPVAQGEAQKKIQDAEAYKQAVVARAEGEAARFLSVYNEYKGAADVTKKRLYLETMEQIMRDATKLIVDEKASNGGVTPYLPLPELQRGKSSSASEMPTESSAGEGEAR